MDPESGINETVSNNILLDVVNSKRTNVIVCSYAMIMHNGEPMHIYCGENNVFMKSQYVEHRIELNGVKRLQSNLFMM